MKTETKNPILGLLFAGNAVRFYPREPEPWPFRSDVLDALGIKHNNRAVQDLPKKWVDTVLSAVANDDSRSGPKTRARHTQKTVIIAPMAAMSLAFRSRKPEAEAFVEWLEEVLQQIAKYGVYVAGADPAERCSLLYHRWKLERATEIATANTELESRGLVTIALFAELNQVELRDVLSFARIASQEAIEAGESRTRVYTRTGMRRAYSYAVLRNAFARLQPQLPWVEESPAAAQG